MSTIKYWNFNCAGVYDKPTTALILRRWNSSCKNFKTYFNDIERKSCFDLVVTFVEQNQITVNEIKHRCNMTLKLYKINHYYFQIKFKKNIIYCKFLDVQKEL